jgi:hypothetical protein
MATVAAKFWFAVAGLAAVAFVLYEFASSGEWFGSFLLGTLVLLAIGLGALATAVRDGDVAADARVEVEARSALPAYWPALAAAGAGCSIVGLAGRNALLYVGFGVVAFVAVEWLVQAWAERATADPAYNQGLRHRVMSPVEIPLVAAAVIGVFLASASRVLLALPKDGAVVFAGALAVVILIVAAIFAAKPKLASSVLAGIVALGAVALIAGGIAGGVAGQRPGEHHGVEHAEDKPELGNNPVADEGGEDQSDPGADPPGATVTTVKGSEGSGTSAGTSSGADESNSTPASTP